jgi:20S proteasome alpha/beta subunit
MSAGRQFGDMQLELLIALVVWLEKPELLKFDGKGLHTADDFNCIGVGNSPLVRFLSDTLYSKQMNTETGAKLGAYIIRKATQYIDLCGGPIDVVTVNDLDDTYTWLSENDVQAAFQKMEHQESGLADLLIRQPFS